MLPKSGEDFVASGTTGWNDSVRDLIHAHKTN